MIHVQASSDILSGEINCHISYVRNPFELRTL